ncbi:MAG: hypothetical protein GX663_02760 [Clostridiales bacterium]|nr:hypothetical protein [Clostridiales bacterium]
MLNDNNQCNGSALASILYLLKDFLYHVEAFRCINSKIDELPGEREFWVYTNDAHIMNAVICWCKVFANYKDKTYWDKIFHNSKSDDAGKMFFGILNEHGISEEKYKELRKQMKEFRDKYIAHSDNYKSPVPHLDCACEVVFCFDILLRTHTFSIFGSAQFSKLVEEYRGDVVKTIRLIIAK